jgi:hypothetical protein
MSTPALASNLVRNQAAITKISDEYSHGVLLESEFQAGNHLHQQNKAALASNVSGQNSQVDANSVRRDKSDISGKPEMDTIATLMFIQ